MIRGSIPHLPHKSALVFHNPRRRLLPKSGRNAMSVIIGYTPDGQPITIGDEERRSGLYVLGKSGTGKSTLLTNMIAQDITNGHGVFFLDPHGEAINDILLRLDLNFLKWRAYILDPEDEHFSFGINLLACQNIHSLKA